MRPHPFSLSLALGLVSVSAVAVVHLQSRAAGPTQQALPGQPDAWTPFQADLVKTHDGVTTFEGRFYRGSDNSIREEGSLVLAPNRDRVIAVGNATRGVVYLFRDGVWRTWSVSPPWQADKPPRWGVHARGLATNPETHEGLVVYRQTSPDGDVLLRAPDLNFFPLVEQRSADSKVLRNIRIGPVPPELFEPPPGVHVIQMQRPGR